MIVRFCYYLSVVHCDLIQYYKNLSCAFLSEIIYPPTKIIKGLRCPTDYSRCTRQFSQNIAVNIQWILNEIDVMLQNCLKDLCICILFNIKQSRIT